MQLGKALHGRLVALFDLLTLFPVSAITHSIGECGPPLRVDIREHALCAVLQYLDEMRGKALFHWLLCQGRRTSEHSLKRSHEPRHIAVEVRIRSNIKPLTEHQFVECFGEG